MTVKGLNRFAFLKLNSYFLVNNRLEMFLELFIITKGFAC